MNNSDIKDIERPVRIRMLTLFTVFITVFLIPFTIVDFVLGRWQIASILVLLLIITVSNYFLLLKSRDTDQAGRFIVLPYMIFALSIFVEGGIHNTGFVWSLFIPVFSFYLLGARKGLVYMSGYSALMLVTWLLSWQAIIPQKFQPLQFATLYLSFIALNGFLYIFENLRNVYLHRAYEYSKRLDRTTAELDFANDRDYLSGSHSSREFMRILDREIQRSRRYGSAVSLLRLSLNYATSESTNFQSNATNTAEKPELHGQKAATGAQEEDLLLKQVSAIINSQLRKIDSYARVTRSDFAIVLPETTIDSARIVEQRMIPRLSELLSDSPVEFQTAISVLRDSDTLESIMERTGSLLERR